MLFAYYKIYREAQRHSKSLLTGRIQLKGSGNSLRMHRGGKSPKPSSKPAYLANSNDLGGVSANGSTRSGGATGNGSALEGSCDQVQSDLIDHQNSNGYEHKDSSKLKEIMSKKISKFAKEKKAAKTLGTVMGVFICSWLPFFVINIISVIWPGVVPGLLFQIVTWLGWLNSIMNPFIYACCSQDLRRAFLRVLRCQYCSSLRQRQRRGWQGAGQMMVCVATATAGGSSSNSGGSHNNSCANNLRTTTFELNCPSPRNSCKTAAVAQCKTAVPQNNCKKAVISQCKTAVSQNSCKTAVITQCKTAVSQNNCRTAVVTQYKKAVPQSSCKTALSQNSCKTAAPQNSCKAAIVSHCKTAVSQKSCKAAVVYHCKTAVSQNSCKAALASHCKAAVPQNSSKTAGVSHCETSTVYPATNGSAVSGSKNVCSGNISDSRRVLRLDEAANGNSSLMDIILTLDPVLGAGTAKSVCVSGKSGGVNGIKRSCIGTANASLANGVTYHRTKESCGNFSGSKKVPGGTQTNAISRHVQKSIVISHQGQEGMTTKAQVMTTQTGIEPPPSLLRVSHLNFYTIPPPNFSGDPMLMTEKLL